MINIMIKPHRTHLRAMTDELQKLFVMLRIIPQIVYSIRPSLSLAIVIDTSISMREALEDSTTKLERAIRACHRLIDEPSLQTNDKISIIQFDDESKVLLPLSSINKEKAHNAVNLLSNFQGGTEMGKGLANALNELSMDNHDSVKRIIVLTDGETFDEPVCWKLAKVSAEINIPILSIGTGIKYNQDLLIGLADYTKGRHLHLSNFDQLEQFILEEINFASREIVTDLKLSISTVKGVNVESVTRSYPSIVKIPKADEHYYRLGNIPANDYTVFIIELNVAGISRPQSRARLAVFDLQASIHGSSQKNFRSSPHELFINFTVDETAVAQIDPEVMDYVQQKNVNNLINQATQAIAQGRLDEARKTIQLAKNITHSLSNPAATRLLEKALEELNKNGKISEETQRTLRAGVRTITVKSSKTAPVQHNLSDEEIRRMTGI